MPSRHIARQDAPDSYYHVFARGASKRSIFLEPRDYEYFLGLLARYLSLKPAVSKTSLSYPHYRNAIQLLSYCLMGNHFHLLIYQKELGSLSAFMKSLMTSYSRYFNLKYKRSGSLFENRYKAARITSNEYLVHISRYIHLNPRSWKYYKYSSISYFRHGHEPEWLNTGFVLSEYKNRKDYLKFVEDYEEHKRLLDEIKSKLAND